MAVELPVPEHFRPERVGEIWRVEYENLAAAAGVWRRKHAIAPAAEDGFRIGLLLVDAQNTFCLPDFELFVAGRSGTGAIDDNQRLCRFIYRNLGAITRILPTMDTHQAMQIFHAVFLVDEKGEHPTPFSLISTEDIDSGAWKVNPAMRESLGVCQEWADAYLKQYCEALNAGGKYALTIWPYHAILGGIGHALVPAVEEAIFFHSIARDSQPSFQIKGDNVLTENYSALSPEVLTDHEGKPVAARNDALLQQLLTFDAVIIAGQAKSHCVAWTIQDLLRSLCERDPALAGKIYLLEDCTSPVVIPDVIDYSDMADEAFRGFAAAGMHIVQSTTPMSQWPGLAM